MQSIWGRRCRGKVTASMFTLHIKPAGHYNFIVLETGEWYLGKLCGSMSQRKARWENSQVCLCWTATSSLTYTPSAKSLVIVHFWEYLLLYCFNVFCLLQNRKGDSSYSCHHELSQSLQLTNSKLVFLSTRNVKSPEICVI